MDGEQVIATGDTRMPLRERLRAALPAAIKARDRVSVSALRSALAAIDNAEAVGASRPSPADGEAAIAHSLVGLGAGDVARRALSEAQIADLVRAEIVERRAAVRAYAQRGQRERAADLGGEADVLAAHLDGRA